MDYRFKVLFLDEANNFLEDLDPKSRKKVLYNIWKSRITNDQNLLKKLRGEIWEFRTIYSGKLIRLLAFWDKSDSRETLVIARRPLKYSPRADLIKNTFLLSDVQPFSPLLASLRLSQLQLPVSSFVSLRQKRRFTSSASSCVIQQPPSHGFIKKTGRIPKVEIEKCEKIRKKYFNEKGE